MRIVKITLILLVFLSFVRPALSQEQEDKPTMQLVPMAFVEKEPDLKPTGPKTKSAKTDPGAPADPFFRVNKDLSRIGLTELEEMNFAGFEAGNYRIEPDFRLGYGDVLNLTLTGKLEAKHTLGVGRGGNIIIPLVGRVGVIGLSLDDARTAVKRMVDQRFTNVEADLSLADVRDIRVKVLGNASNPGTYSVSPFCRISELIVKSGGPSNKGSITDIRLIRGGKEITSFNVYNYIFKADESKNLRLQHADTIFIPETKNLIAVKGNVRYPGIYETSGKTTLSKVLDLAGGIVGKKFKAKVSIFRIDLETRLSKTFKEVVLEPSNGISQEDDVAIDDQDIVVVSTTLDYNPYAEDVYRMISITGEVNVPGDYLLKKGETLKSLIGRAGGFTDIAFIEGAVLKRPSVQGMEESVLDELVRSEERAILQEESRLGASVLTPTEKEMRYRAIENRRKALDIMASRQPEGRIILDLKTIMDGRYDILLEKDDSIHIPALPDWVLVTGAVYNPSSVAFEEAKTLEGYLNTVGGPRKFADKEDVYIIKASGRTESLSIGFGKMSRGDTIIIPEKID